MKDLTYRNAVAVGALPAASAALAGVTVRLTTDNKPYWCDGTQWLDLTYTVLALVREKLPAACTYYVSTTGSDSNNGLTAGTPFLTIQKAFNVAASFDLGAYDVTIQLADGTYTAGLLCSGYVSSGGKIILNGNATTPANVVISTTSGHCVLTTSGKVYVSNLKLQTATSVVSCLVATNPGAIVLCGPGLVFGAASLAHIYILNGGQVDQRNSNSYSIVGSASYHIYVLQGSVWSSAITCTLTGIPGFTAFVCASSLSYVRLVSNTYAGAATGARYIIAGNSVLDSNGAGAMYLPGNGGGSVTSGGQYL